MGSFRAEEQKVESTGINSQRVHDIEEAGTRVAGGKQVNPRDVAAPNLTGVQQDRAEQRGAGDQPENERVAGERQDTDAVFGTIENKLKEQDERERLRAEAYRYSQKQSKKVAKKARGRLGYSPGDSGVESDPDTDDDASFYVEIKNLVLIDHSVIHKKALEECDRKQILIEQRVERKSTEVESRKNEVYQLIGFFSVFQGVVLTIVSQLGVSCSNWWTPVLLSLLASLVTIGGVYQKLKQIWSLENTIFPEKQALKDVARRGRALRREGKDFVFAQFSEGKRKEPKATFYGSLVLGTLLVFTVLFPFSYWRILCHPGLNP